MGSRKWSREKIIDELIKLYQNDEELLSSTMPIRLRSIISKKQYFDSFDSAREAAAVELERRQDFEGAKIFRSYNSQNSKFERKWFEKDIVDELIELNEKGKHLTCSEIPTKLVSAIFNKIESRPFQSLYDAREAAAVELERRQDFQGANRIRKYNKSSLKDLVKSFNIFNNKLKNIKSNEKNLMNALLDKKINFFNQINEKINSGIFYDSSFNELNKDLIKNIPRDVKYFEIDGLRYVRGNHILNCLKKGINNSHYLNLQNLNIFCQNLFSFSNLIIKYKIKGDFIQQKLKKILQKNPHSFFRFQKNGRYSKVITSDLLPYFENTDLTPDIDLSAVFEKMQSFNKDFVDKKINNLESILDKNVTYKDNQLLFEELEDLRFCNAGNTRISIYDLIVIKDLMMSHKYESLDVGKVFSFEEIESLIPNSTLMNKINHVVNKTQWTIFQKNKYLILNILEKIGITDNKLFKRGHKHSILLDAGKDGLFESIQRYDITKNTQFSTYAVHYIKGYILRFLTYKQLKTASLSKQFGDETELIEFIEDENINSQEHSITNQDLKQYVSKKINYALGSLSEKERDILKSRFGLNGEQKKTLREIGKDYSVSHQRINQIIKKALEKLRNKEIIKNLGSSYGLD